MNESLKGKVAEWLKTSGYALEMTVAQALSTAGFDVVQSEYFEDSESANSESIKWRETDVVAYSDYRGKTCRTIFSLVVECKGAKDKPWVIFTSRDTYPAQLSVSRRASNEAGESILNILALRPEIQSSPLFALPERPGYGLTAALRTGSSQSDPCYEALNSVCKAALGIVKRLSEVPERLVPFAWPVVVINAPLFESYLDETGALQVDEIAEGRLIWKNPIITRHTFIDICTRDKFLAKVSALHSQVSEFLEVAAKENDRHSRFDRNSRSTSKACDESSASDKKG